MIEPYLSANGVQIYLGDCRELLPDLPPAVSCVTDPPYGETSAAWDVWPAGWVGAIGDHLPPDASLWCWGSTRMFIDHHDDLQGWRYAQEVVWEKPNGSGPTSGRFVRVHEPARHYYRGRWGSLHHEISRTARAHGKDKSVRNLSGRSVSHHRGSYGLDALYDDNGTRMTRSVIRAPSPRGRARSHRAEKPVEVVLPLVVECTPPAGTVIDPFMGSGSVLLAALASGRRGIGVEKDEAMCELAARRVTQTTQAPSGSPPGLPR